MWIAWALMTSLAGAVPAPLDCGVPLQPPRHRSVQVPGTPPPPAGDKEVRNAYASVPNLYESPNFAIWWGPNGGVTETDAAALADAFEDSWTEQVEVQGYPQPLGADVYKFNVYIGDTGGGTPSAEGAAGYFYEDREGEPMVVIDRDLAQMPNSARLTAAHEFFHAVQEATGSYGFSDAAMWWHEATANWMVDQVYPDFAGNVSTLYAIYTRPEFPLNHFTWAWSGLPEDEHAYAAQLFVSYLEENHGGAGLIQDTWLDVEDGDPLQVIDGLLSTATIGEAHHDYAMKNATWDYAHGDTLAWWASDAEIAFSGDSHRIAGSLSSDELATWQETESFAPQTYGANYWELDSDLPATVTVTLETGDAQSWWLGVATVKSGAHQQSVGVSDGDGNVYILLEDLASADEAWLVVTAVEGSENTGEEYPYRLHLEEGDQMPAGLKDDSEETAGACACAASQARPAQGLWLLAGMGLMWFRRRLDVCI